MSNDTQIKARLRANRKTAAARDAAGITTTAKPTLLARRAKRKPSFYAKRKPKTPIAEGEGTVSFTGPDGSLHVYACQDGGFFLHTRNTDPRINGVSITATELADLAGALTRLAPYDTNDQRPATSDQEHQ